LPKKCLNQKIGSPAVGLALEGVGQEEERRRSFIGDQKHANVCKLTSGAAGTQSKTGSPPGVQVVLGGADLLYSFDKGKGWARASTLD